MFIRKLSANKESFHTIEFQPEGINIILGSKGKSDSKKKDGSTVNGVGKSLSIKLIDYCLGAKKNAHAIISKLHGWKFRLILEDSVKKYKYDIERDSDDGFIKVNNTEKKVGELTDLLEAELYHNIEDYDFISFRGLICRNLRIPKGAYITWDNCKSGEDDSIAILNDLYLLGLDPKLIISKIKDKNEINKIEQSYNYIKKDSTIKEAMHGSDVNIEISNISKEITIVEDQLAKFKISEGYNDIKKRIEEFNFEKNNIINSISKYNNLVNSLNDSINKNIDITSSQVEKIYSEAEIIFPKEMIKSLDEISEFHEKLLEVRKTRLTKDKKKYLKKIDELKKQLSQIDNQINNDMNYIKDKVSTTEYEKLQERLTKLKVQLEKIQQYNKLLSELETNKATIKANMAKENLQAIEYMNNIVEYRNKLSDKFKEYVDYIYESSKYSGIEISNNDGLNKIRYNINPQIQDDGSDGINSVKIFCMDMLMWQFNKKNSVDFLYHDSTLFSDVDPRQGYRMLKMVYGLCKNKHLQYIINLNYNMYESIVDVASENKDNEFKEYLKSCVRLKLYDDDPKNKLLGIDVK